MTFALGKATNKLLADHGHATFAAIAPVQDSEETDANTAKARQTQSNAKNQAIGDLDVNEATTPVSIEAIPSDGPVEKIRKREKAKLAESNAHPQLSSLGLLCQN